MATQGLLAQQVRKRLRSVGWRERSPSFRWGPNVKVDVLKRRMWPHSSSWEGAVQERFGQHSRSCRRRGWGYLVCSAGAAEAEVRPHWELQLLQRGNGGAALTSALPETGDRDQGKGAASEFSLI